MTDDKTWHTELKIEGCDIAPRNEVQFKFVGVEMLRLDVHGFHYKGETIDDAGEAYKLFTTWLRKAQESV